MEARRKYLKLLANQKDLKKVESEALDKLGECLYHAIKNVMVLHLLEYYEEIKYEDEDDRLRIYNKKLEDMPSILREAEQSIIDEYLPAMIEHHINLERDLSLEKEKQKMKEDLK